MAAEPEKSLTILEWKALQVFAKPGAERDAFVRRQNGKAIREGWTAEALSALERLCARGAFANTEFSNWRLTPIGRVKPAATDYGSQVNVYLLRGLRPGAEPRRVYEMATECGSKWPAPELIGILRANHRERRLEVVCMELPFQGLSADIAELGAGGHMDVEQRGGVFEGRS